MSIEEAKYCSAIIFLAAAVKSTQSVHLVAVNFQGFHIALIQIAIGFETLHHVVLLVTTTYTLESTDRQSK